MIIYEGRMEQMMWLPRTFLKERRVFSFYWESYKIFLPSTHRICHTKKCAIHHPPFCHRESDF